MFVWMWVNDLFLEGFVAEDEEFDMVTAVRLGTEVLARSRCRLSSE